MEGSILKALADNPALLLAVRQLIESKFALNISTNMTNEVLGQMVRAKIEGLAKVDEAFKEIEKYQTVPDSPPRFNEAR